MKKDPFDELKKLAERDENLPSAPPKKMKRKHRRMHDRLRLLDARVPDRRCPVCEQVWTKSRSWIIINKNEPKVPEAARKAGIICRSCARRCGYWSRPRVARPVR